MQMHRAKSVWPVTAAANEIILIWLRRQESYFHYLFGVTEEDYYGAVRTGQGAIFLAIFRGKVCLEPS